MPAYRTRDAHHHPRSLEVTVHESSSTLHVPTPRAFTTTTYHISPSSSQSNSPFEPESLQRTQHTFTPNRSNASRTKTVTPSSFFSSSHLPHPSISISTSSGTSESTVAPATTATTTPTSVTSPSTTISSAPVASTPKYHRRRRSDAESNEPRPKKGDEGYVKRPENAFILFRRKCCEDRNSALAAGPTTTTTTTTNNTNTTNNALSTSDSSADAGASENGDADDGMLVEQQHKVVLPMTTGGKLPTKKQRQADLSKMISQQWKNLPADERQYWEDLAKEKKKEHEQLYPHYVYRPQRIKGKKNVMKAKGKKSEDGSNDTSSTNDDAAAIALEENVGDDEMGGIEEEDDGEPTLTFTLPGPAPVQRTTGRRAVSAPTPPPILRQTIQIPQLMLAPVPTSSSTPNSPTSLSMPQPMMYRRPFAPMDFGYSQSATTGYSSQQSSTYGATTQPSGPQGWHPELNAQADDSSSWFDALPPHHQPFINTGKAPQDVPFDAAYGALPHHQGFSTCSSSSSSYPSAATTTTTSNSSGPPSPHDGPFTPTMVQIPADAWQQCESISMAPSDSSSSSDPFLSSFQNGLVDAANMTSSSWMDPTNYMWTTDSFWTTGEPLLNEHFDLSAIKPVEIEMPAEGSSMDVGKVGMLYEDQQQQGVYVGGEMDGVVGQGQEHQDPFMSSVSVFGYGEEMSGISMEQGY